MSTVAKFYVNYVWTWDEVLDPALYAWRVRWFDHSNNPFV
jgi:hypothetical protein